MIGMKGYPVSKGFVQKNFQRNTQAESGYGKTNPDASFENILNTRLGYTVDARYSFGINPSEDPRLEPGYDDGKEEHDPFETTVQTESANCEFPINIQGLQPDNMDRLKKNTLPYKMTSPVRRSIAEYNDYIPRFGNEEKKDQKKLYQFNQDPEIAKGLKELNAAMNDLKAALGSLF